MIIELLLSTVICILTKESKKICFDWIDRWFNGILTDKQLEEYYDN